MFFEAWSAKRSVLERSIPGAAHVGAAVFAAQAAAGCSLEQEVAMVALSAARTPGDCRWADEEGKAEAFVERREKRARERARAKEKGEKDKGKDEDGNGAKDERGDRHQHQRRCVSVCFTG